MGRDIQFRRSCGFIMMDGPVWQYSDEKTPQDRYGVIRNGYYRNSDGSHEWYQNDVLHRLDGPAKIFQRGTRYWYRNGEIHREDGPAVIGASGTKEWFQNGKLHRLDGPAHINANGLIEYWIDGVQYKNEVLWRLEAQKRKRNEKEDNI